MKVQEALKSAIEAFELHAKQYPHMVKGYCVDALEDCKSALSDIENSEVVAWQHREYPEKIYHNLGSFSSEYGNVHEAQPLYTSPISKECEPINEVYAFEKWLKENTLIRASLNIDLDYADPLAEIAYRAWKARAKLNTPEKG